MKYGIFVHPKRPKISVAQIAERIKSAGFLYSPNEPDIGIVVGGDGTFGYYGRILTVPMLFVGVRETNILGSKARLAETMYDRLDGALHGIDAGRYSVNDKSMLSVHFAGQSSDVLTDVYLERGEFAGCIRYAVQVNNGQSSFNEYAIGNGVIVSTSFGSAGYFSYPNRLKAKEWDQASSIELFSDNRLGICHIIPTYLVREGNGKHYLTNKIQYTVPMNYDIKIRLVRDANVRLYGTSEDSKGKQVLLHDKITISPSIKTAKIIKLNK
ncbi:MAG TPA: hypothetical protein VI037_08455 [Nitrososphaera sp.]